jgi:hypothetical protein
LQSDGVGLAPSAVVAIVVGRSVWISLARARFAEKTPVSEGWISLDFLGFSRPNRDLSMGYAGFSLENFFVGAFPVGVSKPGTEMAIEAIRKAQDCHGRELTLFSAFPEAIVADAVCSRPPQPKSKSL